jgi:PPOX class probable F420-dependent enzyme
MNLNDLRDARYIALETFRKNGEAVKTPVWQASEDGTMYVWTDADSWKVKRIRNNNRVRLCQSDVRGKPLSDWVEAQAKILEMSEEDKTQRQRFTAKYGWQFWLFYLIAKLGRRKSLVIEIKPA